MDSLISNITQYSQGHLDILQKKLKDANKVLSRNKGQILTGLEALDPAMHTLGYLVILNAAAQNEMLTTSNTRMLEVTRNFLLRADWTQIKRDAEKFADVARRYGSLFYENKPKVAVLPLQRAMVALSRAAPNTLTGAHQIFVLCCIKAKCYHAALPVVELSFFEVLSSEKQKFDAKDNLLYHYYASSIFIAFKRFEDALDALQLCLTAPTMQLSEVQIEAYKKYVLVSLALHGRVVDLPSYTSSTVSRNAPKMCEPYQHVSEAYQKNVEELRSVLQIEIDALRKDENWGLAKQLVNRLIRQNIKNLTNTYITLSLDSIAEMSSANDAKQAEEFISGMIEKREIFARIDQRNGMVSFLDDTEDYTSPRMVNIVNAQINEIISYTKRIKEANEEVSKDPKYIQKRLRKDLGDQDILIGGPAPSMFMDA